MAKLRMPADAGKSNIGEDGQRVKPRLSIKSYLEKLLHHGLSPGGQEIPDPVPMAPPVGYKKQPSMVDHMRELVRSELLRREAERMDRGSFEEEDDFYVDDDHELLSGYEFEDNFEPEGVTAVKKAVEDAEAKAAALKKDLEELETVRKSNKDAERGAKTTTE